MSQPENWNTELLWKSLFSLLGFLIVLVSCIILYVPLESDIRAYLDRPQYDYEKLAEKAASHARSMKREWDYIENGIHVRTGMPYDANFRHIQSSCLSCHSSKMITQNRATREGWKQMIRWMQATQNLPDLGEKEPFILDYLAEHYAPENTGRRPMLDPASIEWYVLDLE